jgi:hypothetical protein
MDKPVFIFYALPNLANQEGENEFQLRILKEEGIGLLTTRNQKSYLILDRLDITQVAFTPLTCRFCTFTRTWSYYTFE